MRPPGIPVRPLLVAVFVASLALGAGRATPAEAVTFEVNVTDDTDDGVCDATHCSLREAINAANAAAGTDTITFNIGGGGLQTIQVNAGGLGALPEIADALEIDGTTQPGYAGSPLIEVTGLNNANLFQGPGIAIAADLIGSTVRGLVINGFLDGIVIGERAEAFVEASYIGIDPVGASAVANDTGIANFGYVDVSGSVISGNAIGVEISPWDAGQSFRPHASIRGSLIGTDASGTKAIGNATGIYIFDSFGSTIGGPNPEDRNVISGNGTAIYGERFPFSGNSISPSIRNNFIGTDITGTRAIPNGGGIVIVSKPEAVIVGNLISGNEGTGVSLSGPSGSPTISNNRIGTDVTGYRALPNGGNGVSVSTDFVSVGGNLISGNGGHGVSIHQNSRPTIASIANNMIGTAADGVSPLGNGGDGIHYEHSGEGLIDDGNVVAHNAGHGIIVDGMAFGSPTDPLVRILGSRSYANGASDITVVNDNVEISPPTITSYAGGTLSGSACANCDVHVYTHGGRHFRGVTTADGAGAWSIPLDAGGAAIATATDGTNGTSEYSAPFNLGPGPDPDGDGVAEADDNCIAAANSDQANADRNLIDISPPHPFDDLTQVLADSFGDACDGDDDNDGLPDSAETGGPPCASASAPTGPLARDSDRDLATDGAECALGTDPADASSRPPAAPAGDADNDGLPDAFEPNIGTEPNDRDTDDDGVSDGIEYLRYNS
ncbi:MAG TPA: right-handed parallel beta-helix repeat-containing protein, partial [Dehalococcoidia bacterium]|nr:right-handed parallel beta-helix repeat-containing protein [Dehalococcoidia bacterium]